MRYPFDPIDAHRGEVDMRGLARLVGVSARTVHRWRHDGLSEENADRCAGALGLVAYELWPEIADALVAEAPRCATCGEVLDGSPLKRYCDRRCQRANPENKAKTLAYQAEWRRERRKTDPEYAEKIRAENRAYKAEAARALAIAAKRRREADLVKTREARRASYWRHAEKRRAAQRERDRAKAAAKRAQREAA